MARLKRKRSTSPKRDGDSLVRATWRPARTSEQMPEVPTSIPESQIGKLKADLIDCANRNPNVYVGMDISEATQAVSDVAAILCEACQNSLDNILDPTLYSAMNRREVIDHHRSFKDLAKAAEQGCSLCALLYSKPVESPDYAAGGEDTFRFNLNLAELHENDQCGKGLIQLCFTQPYSVFHQPRSHRVLLEQHAGHRTAVLGLPLNPHPPLNVAADWFSECMQSHIKCGGCEATQLPHKLVDVGWSATSPIRLVQAWTGQYGLYAALSHCWGSAPLLAVTIKSNIKSRFQEIPLETLPQNFKDAIQVTRRLGLRYIWIDSLCITQDDRDDWQVQCALMQKIYTNAAVTIAAASASEPSEGFLNQRSEDCWPSVMLAKSTATGAGSDAVLIKISRPPTLEMNALDKYSPRKFLPDELDRGTHSRAWCFQERILSRRLLSFGAEQMHFECLTCEWHERLREPLAFGPLAHSSSRDRIEFHDTNSTTRYTFRTLLKTYSGRALTNVSDRLPAFSGIARMHQEKTGDKYVAGLWQSTLIENLCWYRRADEMNRAMNLSDPLAPSWSWASCVGPVTSKYLDVYGDNQFLAHVSSGHIVLAGKDPFGRVQSGELEISGRPRDCALANKQPWRRPNSCVLEMEASHPSNEYVLLAGEMTLDRSVSQNAFTLFPLVVEKSWGWWHALVLARVPEHPGRYERLGLFSCHEKEFMDERESDFQSANGSGHVVAVSSEMMEEKERILLPRRALSVFKADPRATITIV